MLISSTFSLALILQANLLFHVTCLHNYQKHDLDTTIVNDREALETDTAYEDWTSPPAEAPSDSPPYPYPFESKRVAIVYPVIQSLKRKITSDPHNITDTWVGPDICNKYQGFFCDFLLDYNETVVAGVIFNGYDFDGPELSVDGFIDELPDIIVFHANSNNFKGVIPSSISDIKYLYELDLSNNKYSGKFPNQVFATQLTFLDLRFNSFTGSVPPQAFALDVDVLFINNNNFMQSIPENLGFTPARYVTLANNNFTGPIPKSIGQASKTLFEIVLLNNHLTGCLPREIGLLANATLIDISGNFLTGPIPYSFACLDQMQILNLAHNELFGYLPALVCKLPNLVNMSLSSNYLTGLAPECWKLVHEKVLDVKMNCILGATGQRSVNECYAFFSKPKSCAADKRVTNWVPCHDSITRRKSFELLNYVPTRTRKAEPPRSYAALNPGRL